MFRISQRILAEQRANEKVAQTLVCVLGMGTLWRKQESLVTQTEVCATILIHSTYAANCFVSPVCNRDGLRPGT